MSLVATACDAGDGDRSPESAREPGGTLVIYNAGSLARPIRSALDSFAAREGITVEQESAGSLETARKLTELRRTPDIIALADDEIFARLLVPTHVAWYAQFARNRIVLAYTDHSAFADELTETTWRSIILRDRVEVGRSDPDLDPAGYRTLLVHQLAERHYGDPGLASRLLAAAPKRNVRPKEVELTGLLQAGELDYIWTYESVAQAAALRYLVLPTRIDLGTPAESAFYSSAAVRVTGGAPGETLELRGRPIVYALSVPLDAPHPVVAARAASFLLSGEGARIMRQARLDVILPAPVVGTMPSAISTGSQTADGRGKLP
jgi:molybdate/tungstate transport system substrate-binding protein